MRGSVLPPPQSIGVPGMSEPAFASLIFDRHCMYDYTSNPTRSVATNPPLGIAGLNGKRAFAFVAKSEEPVSTILTTFDRWRSTTQLDTECIDILTDADILYACEDDQENGRYKILQYLTKGSSDACVEFFPRQIVESMASKLRSLPPSPTTDEISAFLRTAKREFDETDEVYTLSISLLTNRYTEDSGKMAVTLCSFVQAETGSRWKKIDQENNALSHARYQKYTSPISSP
ncbi:hypothetical protein CYLTODRAFT_414233 [Cylindrobasidium torrendii FP15055 ss-10]|uniref:Uncharacterized protein n=1 Tax=Cylindrobasidium torrendii FP15055 ss-10 TaxID=1314674 RepID=A0A0D7AY35_9AGAR|nr:hypothetical protein CYLTODRAFT_414233 [Cylindrobasidium torrendii FP15055 ss-10]